MATRSKLPPPKRRAASCPHQCRQCACLLDSERERVVRWVADGVKFAARELGEIHLFPPPGTALMPPDGPLRIHASNGGYLFTLEFNQAGDLTLSFDPRWTGPAWPAPPWPARIIDLHPWRKDRKKPC